MNKHPEPDPRLVWVDMETGGLNPSRSWPIEIAVVITTPDLVVLDTYHTLLGHLGYVSPEALELHRASGLYAEWAEARDRLRTEMPWPTDVSGALCGLLDRHGFPPRAAVLAGSSVHFDRGFIDHHLPRFSARLHYRQFDVSMLREAIRRWVDPDFGRDRPEPKHRAMADVLGSIELGRQCMAVLGRARVQP